MLSTLPFAYQTRIGMDEDDVKRIGRSMGEGVPDKEHGIPEWAGMIQLAQAFGVHPKVFDDYEPSEVDLMTVYLAAYGDGAADKRRRESKRR